jgi:hypothetical protein
MAKPKRDERALVGAYAQETDPEMCARLAEDGIKSRVQIGRYILRADPTMFDLIVALVQTQEN